MHTPPDSLEKALREHHAAGHHKAATKVLDGASRPTWALRTCTELVPALQRNATALDVERARSRSMDIPCGHSARRLVERMIVDTVEPATGGFLEVALSTGWRALLAASEVVSVRPRTEGGSAIYLRNTARPILTSVPVAAVIEAMEGALDATTA